VRKLPAIYLKSCIVFLIDCRIDSEASTLKKKLTEIITSKGSVNKVGFKAAEETTATLEVCFCRHFLSKAYCQ